MTPAGGPDPEPQNRAVLLGVARVAFALLTVAAVVTQVTNQIRKDLSLVNFFSYFTIESNLVAAAVLIVTGVFALTGRPTDRLTGLRGAVTLYMVVTGLVYTALLRNVDVQTSQPWINTVLHYVMPVVLLVDWLVTPRPPIRLARAFWWLAFPVVYGTYSLIRGAATGWYPYPFLNASTQSTVSLIVSIVLVAVVCIVLLIVLVRLPHREPGIGMEPDRVAHPTAGP